MGIGFTVSLVAIAAVRELLGNGTLFGTAVMGPSYVPFLLLILPPGAFILLGTMLGAMNRVEMALARRAGRAPAFRKEHDCSSCVIFAGWSDAADRVKALEEAGR
jgi:electron transport complex protein RnfE